MKGQGEGAPHRHGSESYHRPWCGGSSIKRKANEGPSNTMLYVPDFETDARKSVDGSENTCANDMRNMINAAIDDRINELSGLFRPQDLEYACTNLREESSKRNVKRATEYTDQQLIDLVLGNAGRESYMTPLDGDTHNNILRHHTNTMAEVRNAYRHRREELRDMAKSFIQSTQRNNARFPFWPPDPLDGAAIHGQARNPHGNQAASRQVHIDEHGRLVRWRPSLEDVGQQRERDQDNDRSDQVGANNELLLDAADTFWKCHDVAKTQHNSISNTPSTREVRNDFHSFSNGLGRINHAGHPPLLPPPVHQPHDPHQISLQMETDARHAIERALERYRRQSNIASNHMEDDRVFELIPIPLVRQENAGNNEQQRWVNRLLRRNRANDAADNPAGDIHNGQHPARIDPNNAPLQQQPGWIDLRLAFRRICFAVLTVVAAFICTMLQSVPVDFGDDVVYVNGAEVDRLLFTGLLGPPYTGYHPVGKPTSASQRYDHRVLKDIVNNEMVNLEHFLNEIFEGEDEQREENPMECVRDSDGGLISCDGPL